MVIGDETGMIQISDPDRRAELERLSAHERGAHLVHLLPDDRFLSTGGDGTVKVWQARPPSAVHLLGHPPQRLTRLELMGRSPNADNAASLDDVESQPLSCGDHLGRFGTGVEPKLVAAFGGNIR